jgi:hypothetical protein
VRGRAVGTCFNRQPEKNRVLPQAEGDMTLLMWLGLKSDVSFTDLRDAVSVCAAAPPGNCQLNVSNAERMEPIPPG